MASDEFLLAMLERSPDGAVLCSLQGTCHFINSEGARLTGWSAEQAWQQSLDQVLDLSHPSGKPVHTSALLGGSARALYTLRSREGSARRVEVHSVVLPVEAGAVVLSIRDLGVAGAFEVTDHFLAVLAHALRTPLNAMVGWLHVLKGGSNVPEATAHRAIEGISRALDQQQRLVEDMRDMAHILTGTVVVELHPVELWTSIETVVAEINPQATAKGVRLRVEHRAGRRAVADPPRLQQAVHHLLANAVKYTPRGGEVLVATAEAGDHVEIRVSDSGEPISPDLLPLIFERFGQGDLTVTRGDDGFGLALVKKLIELQGGEAVAQGTGRSTGAHFVLRLPAAQASQAAAGEAGSN